MKHYTVKQLKALLEGSEDIILLDTRTLADFAEGFIPGSILIGNDGGMLEWIKTLLSPGDAIVLVTPIGKEEEYAALLKENGFTNLYGFLDGGYETWKEAGEEIDLIINVDAGELAMDLPFDENLVVLDVRKPLEFAEGHITEARNLPLADLKDPLMMAHFEDRQNLYIHCARGYRSVIAASLFKRQGYNNLRNVLGGWDAIKHTKGIKIEKEKSTLN